MSAKDPFTHLGRVSTLYGDWIAIDPNVPHTLTPDQLKARTWIVAGSKTRVIEDFNGMFKNNQPMSDYVRPLGTAGWLDRDRRFRPSYLGQDQPYVFLLFAADLEPQHNEYGEVTP